MSVTPPVWLVRQMEQRLALLPGDGSAQRDGHGPLPKVGDKVGAIEGLRIAPAEEVQVVPGLLGQVTRHGQALGLALAAVHERGARRDEVARHPPPLSLPESKRDHDNVGAQPGSRRSNGPNPRNW
jgi:hypothetical protein